MRKYLINQCLETNTILEEAHSEIINLIEKSQTDTALGLLEQCQQGAIGVGTIIDRSEGEGTDEVHLLEEYCEMIWQISEDLKTGETINARKLEKKLRKQLLNVSNGIQNRIPTQKEMHYDIYWDGACSADKIKTFAPKGVRGFVLGTTLLFGQDRPYAETIKKIREMKF